MARKAFHAGERDFITFDDADAEQSYVGAATIHEAPPQPPEKSIALPTMTYVLFFVAFVVGMIFGMAMESCR